MKITFRLLVTDVDHKGAILRNISFLRIKKKVVNQFKVL